MSSEKKDTPESFILLLFTKKVSSTVTFYRQNDPCSRVSNTQYLEISYS